jgi:hypothetical protein
LPSADRVLAPDELGAECRQARQLALDHLADVALTEAASTARSQMVSG